MEMFALETKIESLEDINGGLTRIKCYVAYPDKNRKKIDIPKSVFENALPTALGMPIVAHFFKDGELGGHEDDLVSVKFETRKTGKTYAYGFVDYTQMPKWESRNEKEWLTMIGYLFSERFPESKKIIDSNQSMEVKLNISGIEDGYKKVDAMQFMALCSLRTKGVSPTFLGSKFVKFSEYNYENEELEDYYQRMKELFKSDSFIGDETTVMFTEWLTELIEEISEIYGYDCNEEDAKLLYNSFYEEKHENFAIPEKYKHINFKPPVSVAKSAQKGLDMRARQTDSNKCCTPVGLARARQLVNRQILSPNTVKRMKAYFDRHQVDKKGKDWNNESKGRQAYLIWGDEAGYRWAKKIVAQMEKADKENMSMSDDSFSIKSIKVSTNPEKVIDGNVGEKNISKMKTKVLNAPNAKEVISKIFARYPNNLDEIKRDEVDYPLMSERDGVFYYNTGFIKAASSRIEQQKDQPYYTKTRDNIVKVRKKVGLPEQFTESEERNLDMMKKMAQDMYEKYGMRYMPYAMDDKYMYAMDTEKDMAKMMIPLKEENEMMACDYEKMMAGEVEDQEMSIRTVMGMLKEKLEKMKTEELEKLLTGFTVKENEFKAKEEAFTSTEKELNKKVEDFTVKITEKEEMIKALETEKVEFSTKIDELTAIISEKDAKIEVFSNEKTKLEFEAILGKEDFSVLTEEDKKVLMEDFSISQEVLIEKAEALSFRRSKEQGLIQTKEGSIAQFGIPIVESNKTKTKKTAYESVKDYINK